MATGSFRVKGNKEWNSIYFRFKQGNQFDFETSTKIQIPNNRWSKPKQEVLSTIDVNFKEINVKLKELLAFIRKEYEDAKINGNVINKKWLNEKMAFFFNRETLNKDVDERIYFTNYIDTFIEESYSRKTKKNKPVAKRTIQHYVSTRNKILSLENKIGKRIKFNDITLQFHSKFIEHLEVDQMLRNNTIGGYVDDIKLFCRTADKIGYDLPNDFKLDEFRSPSNETFDIYLTIVEINQIYNATIDSQKLSNVRDWFIIGLWTGLRVSDFLKLTKENIKDSFIYVTSQKTKYPVIIPIHEQVRNILNKRNGELPNKISDQKFNDYVKELCKEVGFTELVEGAKICPIESVIEGKKKIIHRKVEGKFPKYELISSHICRRSFASNLYSKIDTMTIMKITGHKTETQFLKYIKITPKEYAEKLEKFWLENSSLLRG